jgi:hypothetical protein
MSFGLADKFFSFDLNKSAAHLVKFKKFKKSFNQRIMFTKTCDILGKKNWIFFRRSKNRLAYKKWFDVTQTVPFLRMWIFRPSRNAPEIFAHTLVSILRRSVKVFSFFEFM